MTETNPPADDLRVADDILRGAAAIADETGKSPWVVYKLFAAGKLPGCWKDGGVITGSKRAIRNDHARKARASGK
jgi:hypothetical protein